MNQRRVAQRFLFLGLLGLISCGDAADKGTPSTGSGNDGGTTGPDGGTTGPDGSTPPGQDSGPPATDGGPPSAGVLGHPGPGPYPAYSGFTLALVEEFDAPLDLDNDAIWTWSDGGLAEGMVRFIKEQITFQSGNMILTADTKPAALSIPPKSYAENGNVAQKALVSGELRTKYNDFRYGRYEVRLKPPTSNGNFISTLFVFRTPKNLFWREIDVELTANNLAGLGTNVYRQDNNTTGYDGAFADVGLDPISGMTNVQQDFHIYAIEWMPDHINWYVDGQLTRTKDATHGNNKTVTVPEMSAKILMNLWIFDGNGFGGTGTNQYPLKATYDWFRFYKANAPVETTYPCTPTPGCLPPGDVIRSKNNPDDGVPFNPN
jgi:beta-glucanase (GH16 family)